MPKSQLIQLTADIPECQLLIADCSQKGNASQEVLLLRGWLKISARAKYRFADD